MAVINRLVLGVHFLICRTVLASPSLTSTINGRVRCPGVVISFMCTHDPPEDFLQWTIRKTGLTNSRAQYNFPFSQPPAQRTLMPDVFNATATLISTSPAVVSNLTLIVTSQLDGAIVECIGPGQTRANTVVNVGMLSRLAGKIKPDYGPSPPRNVMVSIIQNGTATVTVNIDWDPPNGGGTVDRYTVETSPETATVRVTSDTRTTTLDLSYNQVYDVRVTAENCSANSTAMYSVMYVGCPIVITRPNVTFDPYASSSVGSVISYQCRPGFIPEGRMMSVCGGDGIWNPDPEQYSCTEVNCGAPILPVNTTMLQGPSDRTKRGSEVTFQCNKGLFPSSEITIVCTSEQRWSPDPQRIKCRSQSTGACNESSNLIVVTIATAATCSVVSYIGGMLSGLLISRHKRTPKKASTSHRLGSTKQPSASSSPSPSPVYEQVAPTSDSGKTEIELQENAAYHPL